MSVEVEEEDPDAVDDALVDQMNQIRLLKHRYASDQGSHVEHDVLEEFPIHAVATQELTQAVLRLDQVEEQRAERMAHVVRKPRVSVGPEILVMLQGPRRIGKEGSFI